MDGAERRRWEERDSDMRTFMRELLERHSRLNDALVAVLDGLVTEIRQLRLEFREETREHRRELREHRREMGDRREQVRANTGAVLAVLDRLPPPRGAA